jgi:CheY-like chemotaxis protein
MIVTGLDSNPDVVLVEDNEDEAEISLRGLRKIRPLPTVMVVNDGQQALNLLTGESPLRPRVVLLDLKLPKVHGLDILAAVKADQAHHESCVLVLTSSDHPSDITRAKALGCDDYLCKPVDWQLYMKLVCSKTAARLEGSICPEA